MFFAVEFAELLSSGLCSNKTLFPYSDDGLNAGRNIRSTRGVLFQQWCATEEVPRHGVPRGHGVQGQ